MVSSCVEGGAFQVTRIVSREILYMLPVSLRDESHAIDRPFAHTHNVWLREEELHHFCPSEGSRKVQGGLPFEVPCVQVLGPMADDEVDGAGL